MQLSTWGQCCTAVVSLILNQRLDLYCLLWQLCVCVCVCAPLQRAEECDGVVPVLKESQVSLSSRLREEQQHVTEVCSISTVLADDLNDLQDTKDQVWTLLSLFLLWSLVLSPLFR